MQQYEPTQPYGGAYAESSPYRRQPHVVPPPNLTFEDKTSVLVVSTGSLFNLSVDTYGDPEFVGQISRFQPLRFKHVQNTWKYPDKYSAQSVLPFLYVGPMTAARDRDFIKAAGISMVIAIRDAAAVAVNPKIMDPARYSLGSHVATITFDITDESDLIHRFRPIVKLINNHLKERTAATVVNHLGDIGGRVLVFCEAGDSRSPILVVLYLMAVFGLDTRTAIQAVQSQRFGILISENYGRMIGNTEQILSAERQVAGSSNQTSKKRNFDQAWEEDVVMDDADLAAVARPGTAPFKAISLEPEDK